MPEQDATTKEFIEEYGKLRDKYKRDFMAIPQFTPNEKGVWDLRIIPQVVSTEDQPTPSPLIM